MTEPTSKSLRALANVLDYDGGGLPLEVQYAIEAHADTWAKLEQRVEALETAFQDAYLNGFHAGRTATLAVGDAAQEPTDALNK